MTTLYLVRHGETVDNANQIMQGQTQGELNENGVQQAREFSEQWKNKEIDIILASDLKRSIDTARIIAEPHQLEVLTTPLLRERDWGSFTGRYIPDLIHRVCQADIPRKEGVGRRPWHHQQSYTIILLSKTNERNSKDAERRGPHP